MTDTVYAGRTPGIVIFVAVLNFIGSFFLFLGALICAALLLFGNLAGIYDAITRQITQMNSQYNLSLGMNFLFGIMMVILVLIGLFYLLIGIGLLKGRKLAWYFQIALSLFGVLGFPFGTILNVLILVFFFQPSVRDRFGV